MTWREIIGGASAATLGYISGGFRGAKTGFKAWKSLPNSMKRKAPRYLGKANLNSKKARVTKTTTTTKTTRVNRKKPARRRLARTKGCKPLSKCMKKQVANIALRTIHKERPLGRYDKHVLYNFPTSLGSPTDPIQTVVNQLVFGSSGGYTDANMAVGSYNKLVDSISVLFNGKAAAFYNAAGNINPAGTIVPDFSHLAVYQFTNNTPVTQHLLIYETTPKEDRSQSVYDGWLACNNTQVGGTTRAITYFGNRPEKYSQFRDAYRILKKKTIILKPGQRFSYSLKTSSKHLKMDDGFQLDHCPQPSFAKLDQGASCNQLV
ncbi:putative capsid protein [Odonata-associated circular virus-12]|nr:putative capsid protein [Odonata-associated circular virus-12]